MGYIYSCKSSIGPRYCISLEKKKKKSLFFFKKKGEKTTSKIDEKCSNSSLTRGIDRNTDCDTTATQVRHQPTPVSFSRLYHATPSPNSLSSCHDTLIRSNNHMTVAESGIIGGKGHPVVNHPHPPFTHPSAKLTPPLTPSDRCGLCRHMVRRQGNVGDM
jgi:hypothetical protein